MIRAMQPTSDVRQEDCVVLFPSLGRLEPDGKAWEIDIHGDVFTRGRVGLGKRILLKLLQRAMKASNEAIQSPLFQQRIDRFLANDSHGRSLSVRVGNQAFAVPKKSQGNGHFFATLRLTLEEAERLSAPMVNNQIWLPFEMAMPVTDSRQVMGAAQLLPPEGISIISDIDDTIKHSQVANKRTLLNNTFLKEYELVPGIVSLFQQWQSLGAGFHYVSSSPWQLYTQLANFFREQGLPTGSFHLRAFRLRDHLIRRLLLLRRSGKATYIRQIMKAYPHRKFVLVGDSGEADPEIYASMASMFPSQVQKILIRKVATPKDQTRRFAKTLRYLPPHLTQLFEDVSEIREATRELRFS